MSGPIIAIVLIVVAFVAGYKFGEWNCGDFMR